MARKNAEAELVPMMGYSGPEDPGRRPGGSPPPPPSPLQGEGEAGGETPPLREGADDSPGLPAVLAPFSDNLPYDRDRVIQECKLCLQMEIMCRFEVGRRLILLKNYEGCATLQHILDDQLGGMERTSAWRYMLFAKKAAELPRFRAFAEGKDNWSKAIALLQCCEDEDLAAFEEGADLLGLKRDELDGLSVRELKARIKKLKKDKEEAVKKATYQLAQENQELKAEVAGLQVALAGPDLEEAFKAVKAAEKKFHDGALLLRAISPGVLEREEAVRNLIFAGCDMLRRLLTQIEHNAQDALNRVLMAEASDMTSDQRSLGGRNEPANAQL